MQFIKDKDGTDDGRSNDGSCWCNDCLDGGCDCTDSGGRGTTAAVASALTAESPAKGKPISVTADTVVNNAPDNFWTLLGKLISMGGWALILIVVVPMLFSWLMPGPIQFKGKKKK